MWKLIDYETKTVYNGIDEEYYGRYLLRNSENEELVKWVDEYDYSKLKELGLIKL